MKCDVRQHGDRMRCETCGLEWDADEVFEPTCTVQKIAAYHAVDGVRGELNAVLRWFRALELAAVSLGVLVLIYAGSVCAP